MGGTGILHTQGGDGSLCSSRMGPTLYSVGKAEFRDGGLGAPQPTALASRNVPLYLMPFLGDRSLSSPSLEFDWIMTYQR